jgi:hypothetical protein
MQAISVSSVFIPWQRKTKAYTIRNDLVVCEVIDVMNPPMFWHRMTASMIGIIFELAGASSSPSPFQLSAP